MNEKQKRHYRARMAVAQLFRSFLNQDGERARLMKRLGVETMPVIVPALVIPCHLRFEKRPVVISRLARNM